MGKLQFEVFQRRLQDEYNVNTNLTTLPYGVCRWVKLEDVPNLPSSASRIEDREGRTALLFETDWELNYFIKNNPDFVLMEHPLG
jgi:peptide chain release factor 3